jgi:hypothetical protein
LIKRDGKRGGNMRNKKWGFWKEGQKKHFHVDVSIHYFENGKGRSRIGH